MLVERAYAAGSLMVRLLKGSAAAALLLYKAADALVVASYRYGNCA
jgi:hypothetical protein